MSADETPATRDEPQELQFDRVESTSPAGDAGAVGVTCAMCGKDVGDAYYHANGKTICDSCRQVAIAATVTPRSPAKLVIAALFGLGAAIAGAAIYYAVIAIANLEIGIVAILIGYMVGWAVRKGAGGRGGRRFQIVAVVLTYWAVGLAYAPLAYKGIREGGSEKSAVGDSATARRDAPSTATPDSVTAKLREAVDSAKSDTTKLSSGGFALGLGAIFLLIFALPVISVFGSMPFGLLSALIIFIGMRQAWAMTAAPKLEITGPYRVFKGVRVV